MIRQATRISLAAWVCLAVVCSGCGKTEATKVQKAGSSQQWDELPNSLADLQLFQGPIAEQKPVAGVLHYELNTPLFSDYTAKYRFIKLPAGSSMQFINEDVSLEFPVGTLIAKTFAYPHDQRDPAKGQKLLETRILKREAAGWIGVSYLWNDEQTAATQKLTGSIVQSKWTHFDGNERTNAYIVPNANQCKGCHGPTNQPIGPKPRNLNRPPPGTMAGANQLELWRDAGVLQGLKNGQQVHAVPVWNQETTGSLEQRVRAWLDINCAHCHDPTGPARQSGLDLRYTQLEPAKRGVMKTPVAAGRGSGGKLYDVVPGKPDESILIHRLESTEPGIMMPELPRRMVDEEGVNLIRSWINSLK